MSYHEKYTQNLKSIKFNPSYYVDIIIKLDNKLFIPLKICKLIGEFAVNIGTVPELVSIHSALSFLIISDVSSTLRYST